ncbi:hypothetical protein LV75_002331 [Actinokineospora diospyrosa]|uniref:Uncharacterized protein n=1 Tax=Actinokineospora diospyrosa TaxID=103728 RepID=A0ABT1IB50_9PSEU|nr:hypothetical protein [Actinokineospora diospyrosa]
MHSLPGGTDRERGVSARVVDNRALRGGMAVRLGVPVRMLVILPVMALSTIHFFRSAGVEDGA